MRALPAAVTVVCLAVLAGGVAQATPETSAARCKIVVKKLHGKKHRRRVCKKKQASLPVAGTIAATVPLGAGAGFVKVDDSGGVWVTTDADTIVRIDPATAHVSQTIPMGPDGLSLGIAPGAVWASNFDANTVSRIDPASGAVMGTFASGGLAPEDVAFLDGSIWIANHHGDPTGSVTRIDPATGAVIAKIRAGKAQDCCGPQGLAAVDGSIWVAIPNEDAVERIDPATNSVVAKIPVGNACGEIAGDATAIWVASACEDIALTRIDPTTNRVVKTISLEDHIGGIALAFGSVWAMTRSSLDRINPATNKVVARLKLRSGDYPLLDASADALWIGLGSNVVKVVPR